MHIRIGAIRLHRKHRNVMPRARDHYWSARSLMTSAPKTPEFMFFEMYVWNVCGTYRNVMEVCSEGSMAQKGTETEDLRGRPYELVVRIDGEKLGYGAAIHI